MKLRVLVACEFSGIVRDAFAAKGHDAWSCDLLPTERPGQHIQGDVLKILNDGWGMMIAHPPCTYICAGSMNWINRQPGRRDKMKEAVEFVRLLWNAPIHKIAIENPVGVLSTQLQKPTQIIRAYQFGHPYKKDTCLWLKNLPKLTHNKETNLFYEKTYADPPYKTFDFWSSDRYTTTGGSKKSVTFEGIAQAMAEQWGSINELKKAI